MIKRRKRRTGVAEQSQHKDLEKRTKFYPGIARQKKRNLYFAEFVARGEGDPSLRKPNFDPTELEYQYPDFGFDNSVSYNEGQAGWNVFLDYIKPQAKFQRAHNYVKYVTDRKEELLKAFEIGTDRHSPERDSPNITQLTMGGNGEKIKAALA